MKVIKKGLVIKAIEDLQDCYNGFSGTYDKACIIGVIDEIPVIDAVPVKRGKWLFDEFDGSAQCSECMAVVEADEWENHNWYFCYHCGARMENWNE